MQRTLATLAAAALAGMFVSPVGHAATPSEGTLSPETPIVEFSSGPFPVSNPTPVPLLDSGPRCNPAQPCDDFTLTVDLPPGYADANPNDVIRFTIIWDDAVGLADYDLYVFEGIVAGTNGSQRAKTQAASSANPEVALLGVCQLNTDLELDTATLTVKVVPFVSTGETVSGTIELVEGEPPEEGASCEPPAFGQPTPTVPGVPRYQTFVPPEGSTAELSDGEANIGFNPFTGNIMMMSLLPVFRITPPELLDPPLPEAGPARWTDVTPLVASTTTLDPILVTDQDTGRTFISNQTTGANALFAFTDDDGDTWIEASASPPVGGFDHQTIGVGPYPAPFAGQNPVYPNAVYYCSQAAEPDFCQRSDTGGLNFGPGVPITTGVAAECGGIHGHLKVAPDGTAYVPIRFCGDQVGGAVSTDAGITWSEFLLPDRPGNKDPSIAIDTDNTAYFCHVPDNGSPRVRVSTDRGQNWVNDFDIGEQVGVVHATFVEAVAGDPGRAACGFLATNVAGDFQSEEFPGRWFLYIAHTYDGGLTWTTVNATPNDPVQGVGGICLGGLGCSGNNRNLLDFNEVTMDDRGRVVFGYNDGCVSERCLDSGGEFNDFVAHMRVARQSGGKTLLAEFDPVEPAAPKAPFLDGTRDPAKAVLTWNPPDDGGADITAYQVFRDTIPGAAGQDANLIATVSGDKTKYVDATVDAAVPEFFYQVVAVNDQGEGPASNEVSLEVTQVEEEDVCKPPGLTILTDASGDSLTDTPGTDLMSFQLAQPFVEDGEVKLLFQVNTDPGVSPQPPQSYWYVSFRTPDGEVHGVRMVFKESSPVMPIFESYVAGESFGGVTDGRFVVDGSEIPADPSSSYDPASGTIVIVVPIEDLGLQPGDMITGFNSAVIQAVDTPVVGAALPVDEMPNGLGRTGEFTVNENAACAENDPPVAVLTADPTSGPAPLTVAFDGSESSDPDEGDTVASYTFDFGDGSDPVTQSEPTVSHTYNDAGTFTATLTVSDSRGLQSPDTAEVVIEVTEAITVTEVDDSDPAIDYDAGWHRRRDEGASNGGYHRRMGGPGGGGPSSTARLAFEGHEITYFFGRSQHGGTADVFLDGVFRETVDFSGPAPGRSPAFGQSITFGDLGEGSHELLIAHRAGAVYVDGFEILSRQQAKPQQ